MFKHLLFLIISILIHSIGIAQSTPKVLIIGIDGCRQDALITANTPNIDALMADGVFSLDALTESPTWSGVGWSGMLTGVWRDKHGVNDNSFIGSNYDDYPHIFNAIESCDANKVTASIVHWGPINNNILDQADYSLVVGTDLEVRDNAVDYLTNNDPDILFLHFDDVDHAGHNAGFSPAIPSYLQSIEITDEHIGHVLNAVYSRPNYNNEDWVILCSTDHGGDLSGHGGSSFEERNIFVIASGNSIPTQQISKTVIQHDFDHSMRFNGVNQYVNVPNMVNYNFGANKDFTIECMVKVNNIDGDAAIISNKNWNSGINNGFVFSFDFPDGPEWKVNIGDGFNRVDISGPAINDGEWHHLAVTFDRDGLMTMYHDGSLVQANDMSSIGDIDSGYPIAIGQDGTHTYGSWFDGTIAEVKVWSGLLDATTISNYACMTVDDNHPYYNLLINYWPLDEGSGNTINDLSSYQNHGTVTGSNSNWLTNDGSIVCEDFSQTPRIVDVAVTAYHHLCYDPDPTLYLDGNTIIPETPLAVDPTEYLNFKGEALDKVNLFKWIIEEEHDIKYFVLERSSGQNDFGSIANIAIQDNILSYTFADQNPTSKGYYHLKIIDQIGNVSYSDIVYINRVEDSFNMESIQPNPINQFLRLTFQNRRNSDCRIKIIDIQGRLIRSENHSFQSGEQILNLDCADLERGLYYLILENNNTKISKRFIKQ